MQSGEVGLRTRAESVLAGGPGTFSKHWSRYPEGIAPFGIVSGEGAYVTGTNGRTYIDTVGALGGNLLGYRYPGISEAVTRQLQQGTSFSMVHPLEIEVAELLCELIPCADMVRFCRNGTDATGIATRLARAITGKRDVIFFGYAGGSMDSYGSTTDRDAGILPEIREHNYQFAWADIEQVVADFSTWNDLACIMVEVPALAWETDDAVFTQGLQRLKTLAWQRGALFIIDEIVTLPRYGLHGAQDLYGVVPDLCTVSKGIANGLPLAALVGKREYMEYLNRGTVFSSWTFAGETTALAACKATLEICRDTDALRTIRKQGQRLGNGLQQLIQEYALPAQVYGNYARIAVRWQDAPGIASAAELRTLWLQHHAILGILHGIGVMFVNSSWDDVITDTVLRAAEDTCRLISSAVAADVVQRRLACPVITDVMSVR